MTEEQKKLWKAEKYGYSKAFTAIKGDTVRVADIESYHEGQIGYTSAGHTVHLAYDHECMKGLNNNGKHAFRCGVGVHELMHQLLTDFVITNRQINTLPSGIEREIYAMLANYVEDARIEHFAYQFVGGTYLKCLDFAIAWTYKTSQKINEGSSPFEQFMIAVQQFGDMGVLKGRFTFDEAKEAFYKAVPLYYKATCEVNPRRVMKYTKEIFEISRPLWKNQKDMEDLIRKMQEEAEKSGRSLHGKGEGGKASTEASEEDDDSKGSGASERRKMVMREVSRRTFEEAKESSGSGKGSGSGEMVKCKDAKTAEEAREAAEEAAEDVAEAKEAAKEAKEAAKEAKGTAREESAKKAAEKAKAAAERAQKAADEAAKHADASEKAKSKGDAKGEEENAKAAGKDALRANAAMKSAENASDMANGRTTGSEKSETAQDAAENASDAQESADAAEAAAQAAEAAANEAAESGDAEAAERAQKAAEKAREAANKAKEAAERAKESAEKAESAQEAEDEMGESANARNAQSAAREAAREAAKAENAANGPRHTPGEEANDAVTMDYSQASETDSFATDASDRAINGARPDYSNCADEVDDGDDFDPTPTEFIYEDYVLTDDDFASIDTEVRNCLEDVAKEEADAAREEAVPLPDFEITSARIGKAATCLNRRVKVDDVERSMELYSNLMTKLRPGINSLYGRLRNIFQNDLEVTDYRSSGKLNFKRVNNGRMTARVFDKHRLPSEKAKTAVMILVDESGSMSGHNSRTAKETAIALAETFHRLDIPTYIIGFTADTSGADAVHNHYVTWKNSMNERLRLLDITARSNNFDGYSIRYGGEILRRVNSEHKLMVVVSDGNPACSYYRGMSGIVDTKDAIRSVRSFADVLGVHIGPFDVEDLQSMYGNDFINVQNVDDLFASLAKRVVHIVNRWD